MLLMDTRYAPQLQKLYIHSVLLVEVLPDTLGSFTHLGHIRKHQQLILLKFFHATTKVGGSSYSVTAVMILLRHQSMDPRSHSNATTGGGGSGRRSLSNALQSKVRIDMYTEIDCEIVVQMEGLLPCPTP